MTERPMVDSIYENVKSGTEALYQQYFERALSKIDVENFTNQTRGKFCNKQKLTSDYKLVEKITTEAKEKDDLSPMVLQVMLEQYFWADVIFREMEKGKWIYRVINRKDEDFFPDSMTIYKNILDQES